MTYSRNLTVIALCGVLVSALASIGILQYAQIVSFGAMDPNTAQNGPGIEKRASTCINPRSIMQNLFSGISKQRPCPSVEEEEQAGVEEMHAAPPVNEPINAECAGTTNARRRAACNAGTRIMNETNQ